jgi:molybdopterin/thiamine biosynthesis adenylyltransferase
MDRAIPADVTTDVGAKAVLDCDLVMVATDNLLSRTVVNRLMAQYLIPLIDAGIDIDVAHEQIRAIGGRVTRVVPGGLCLTCVGILDPGRVATEVNRTYLAQVEAPSVVSLNGVVGSLAVNDALDYVTGFASDDLQLPRSLVFDGRRGTVRTVAETGKRCGICDMVLGAGDRERLPVTHSGSV